MRRARSVDTVEHEPDHILTQRAAEGDNRAFEELYRRHAPAAWRMAYAVAGNPDDAADAVSDAFTRVFQMLPSGRLASAEEHFRPYLLAATRNAALDCLRRQGRTRSTSNVEQLDRLEGDVAGDRVLDVVDSSLVAAAFNSLPERWRSVLWLTEVEGIPAREAAPLLGISANGLAQLAVRARAGLRQRFLQAHVRTPVARSCKFPVDRLGAYIAGGLSPRETAKVDEHLAGCADCRQQVEELEDLGSLLRRVVLPVPLALGAVSLSKWKLATHAASAVRRKAAGAGLTHARKPILAVAVATFALGVIGATVLRSPYDGERDQSAGTAAGPTRNDPVVVPFQPAGDGDAAAQELVDAAARSATTDTTTAPAATSGAGGNGVLGNPDPGGGGGGGGGGGDGGDGGESPEPPPPGQPLVQANASVAEVLGVSIGAGENSCTSLQLTELIVGGDCPPPPGDGAVRLQLNGGTINLLGP
jgi:RNA polymerase sigma factor (sigma-70 family)